MTEDRVQQPWQRSAAWAQVEVIRAGRPGRVLATRDGEWARLIEESPIGYTIREVALDCRRGTMRMEQAHGHVFGMAVQRAPDPISAIVTPAGVRTLCATHTGGATRTPEDALKAVMAKQGVVLPRPRDGPNAGVVDPATGRPRLGYAPGADDARR